MCMRVEFAHTKKGLSALCARLMKSSAASVNSSLTVSIRLVVSGPVFSIFCLPTGAKDRIDGRIGFVGRPAVHDTARPEALPELGVLRVVRILGFFFGVQVVQVAEELVEAVRRRQELVLVAQVILAELAGHVALRLEAFGDSHVVRAQALIGAR